MRLTAQFSIPSCTFIFLRICSFSRCSFHIFHFSLCCRVSSSSILSLFEYYNLMIRVSGRGNPLNFRCISQMDEQEAQELALKLNLFPETRKAKPREENLIIRNGVIKKLEPNELNFITQETKIITDFNPQWEEERIPKNQADQRPRDMHYQQKNYQSNTNIAVKRSASFIEEFVNEEGGEAERIKEEYCRVWYEKIALEAHVANLEHENHRKDEVINQLRQQLEMKHNSQPHFMNQAPVPHSNNNNNKSVTHHPSFSLQAPLNGQQQSQSGNHWGSVHPNRNFNISQPSNGRNF